MRKELTAGTLLNRDMYRIERVIGSGGFGITYYVLDAKLKHFAVKEYFIDGRCVRDGNGNVVPQTIPNEVYKKYLDRFVEEAQTLARFQHSNIVRVNRVFYERNTAYMVMDYIEGQTLKAAVQQTAGKRLEYDVAVNYILQISDAVEFVHAKNILHRDIKPDNIIITPSNQAILIDFGSARDFEDDRTIDHSVIITPGYAPFEQYSKIARRGSYTDIYALGATFYYCLTGCIPTDAVERMHNDDLLPPSRFNTAIPSRADKTIMKAMQLKSENRYQKIEVFRKDLMGVYPPPPPWVFLLIPVIISFMIIAIYNMLKDEPPYLNVSPTELSFDANGGRQHLNYSSNLTALEVFGLPDWCSISKDLKTLYITCSRNTDRNSREEAFKIGSSVKTISITVSQKGKTLTAAEHQQLNNAKRRAKEFYDFAIKQKDRDYFKNALEACNQALALDPNNSEMKELKRKIQQAMQ
ncbi:MAG: protein kinase [Tannerella sp.]|jgi:serine/threonine protein kinase|nr:protein kinase [Tannerella sp.]